MLYVDYPQNPEQDEVTNTRHYFYQEIPALKLAIRRRRPDKIQAVFAAREWAASVATYSERARLIPPSMYWELPAMLKKLQAFEGGLWCGGSAIFYTTVLNTCYVPAVTFSYGYGELSHVTTLACIETPPVWKYYIVDAYLGYHFTDTQGKLMELMTLLEHVKAGRYKEIVRVDEKLYRHLLVGRARANHYRWLFDDNELPEAMETESGLVYSGASHSLDKLLMSGGFVDLANDARGSQPLDEFMLDLMLVNPSFSRIKPTCGDCYLDWHLHESVVKVLGRSLV